MLHKQKWKSKLCRQMTWTSIAKENFRYFRSKGSKVLGWEVEILQVLAHRGPHNQIKHPLSMTLYTCYDQKHSNILDDFSVIFFIAWFYAALRYYDTERFIKCEFVIHDDWSLTERLAMLSLFSVTLQPHQNTHFCGLWPCPTSVRIKIKKLGFKKLKEKNNWEILEITVV